jgi:phosphocarrier protein HPr
MAWLRRTLRVQNRLGLHMRAAALLVQTANRYEAEITYSKDDQTVNGKSIIGLMMLAATQGSEVEAVVEGPQAQELLDALCVLFEQRFNEEG